MLQETKESAVEVKRPQHPMISAYLEKDIPEMIRAAKENSDFLYFVDDVKKKFAGSFLHGWVYAGMRVWDANFQFNSMDEAKEVLAFISKCGYKRRGESREDKHSKCLTWQFDRVTVNGYFLNDGGQCRYVQTGEKTITVPVMELVCDNKEDWSPKPIVADLGELEDLPF